MALKKYTLPQTDEQLRPEEKYTFLGLKAKKHSLEISHQQKVLVPQRKVAVSKVASPESSSLQFPKAQDKPLAKQPTLRSEAKL